MLSQLMRATNTYAQDGQRNRPVLQEQINIVRRMPGQTPAFHLTSGQRETEPKAAFSLSPDYCGDEFFLEDKDFVAAVREGRPPKVGVEQALLVQEFMDAMYRAMVSGQYVELTEDAGA